MTRLVHTGEYPADWPEISLRVRAEVGNRCVRCGHPSGDVMQPESDDDFHYSGRAECGERRLRMKVLMPCDERCTHRRDGKLRALTVHHMDGDKSNCQWWNLLPLCQVCHLQIQAKLIPDRLYLLPHSPWFIVYVCGYYAYVAGVAITREEALATPERWLELGQPHLFELAAP